MAHPVGKLSLIAAAVRCAADRSGITAIEYALIASVIVISIAALVRGIGGSVSAMFSRVVTGL